MTNQDKGKLVCKAWDGSRSSEFSNAFVRDFSLGADAKYMHDDDHSLWAAMTDNDQYGSGPLAEAGPTQGQAGYGARDGVPSWLESVPEVERHLCRARARPATHSRDRATEPDMPNLAQEIR